MDYTDELFERCHLQKIRGYLTEGEEPCVASYGSYDERLEEAAGLFYSRLEAAVPREAYENLRQQAEAFARACQEVNLERGMQAGAMLLLQLLPFTPQ